MTYADFTLEDACDRLGLTTLSGNLFPNVRPAPVPSWLTEYLSRTTSLSRINEKSRNEFLVAPVLTAVGDVVPEPIALFSGHRLDIDPEAGLVGECDFILARTPPVPWLRFPFVVVVQAFFDCIEETYGRCIAQMVGVAQWKVRRELQERLRMYGCVTNGTIWHFLKLDEAIVTFDNERRYASDLGPLLGVFRHLADECRLRG